MASKKPSAQKKSGNTAPAKEAAEETKTEEQQPVEQTETAPVEEPKQEETVAEETQPEPKTEEPAAAEEPAPVEDEEAPVEEAKAEPTAGEKFAESVDPKIAGVAMILGDYANDMRPGAPQTPESIARNQLRLRGAINSVLTLDDAVFEKGMKALIKVVRDNRDGAFSELRVFRGFPQLRLSAGERKKMEVLISLFMAAADVKNPKDVNKSVDLNVVLKAVRDNEQQQRLISYFGE